MTAEGNEPGDGVFAPSAVTDGGTASTDLAGRLRALAGSGAGISMGDRRRLRQLASALPGGADAAQWAGVDLRRMFDGEAIAAGQATAEAVPAWLHPLELIRNVLILAPVGWTWFGISAASNAYQQTLTANPDLGPQPFLLLWQRGFYGRLDWLPFSRMAFIDTGLVLFVVALTLILYFRVDQAELEREQAVLRARQEFDDLLADAALCLSDHAGGQAERARTDFANQAERLLQQLTTEREHLDRIADQREQQLAELAAFSSGLIGGVNRLLEFSQSVAAMYAGLSAAMRDLSGTVAAMASDQRAALESGRRGQDLFAQWLADVKHLAGSLGAALDGATAASAALREEVQSLLTGHAGYMAGLGNANAAQQTFLDRLTQYQGARDATDADLVLAQRQFLEGLGAERQAQEELARSVSQALVEMVGMVKVVQDESANLRMLAVGLDDLSRSFPLFVQEVKVALNEMAVTQLATAEQLRSTGLAAETSVQNIVGVTDGWQQAVSGVVGQCRELTTALRDLQAAAGRPRPGSPAGDGSPAAPRVGR